MYTPPHHEIVGFEGRWRPSDGISYGCAAVVSKDHLHNPLLGTTSPIEDLDRYVEEGAVTLLENPIHVPVSAAPAPFVLVLPTGHRVSTLASFKGSLGGSRAEGYHALAYASFESLKEDMVRAARSVVAACRDLVEAGLVLDVHGARMNALRAVLTSGDGKLARAMARASLRSDEARAEFDSLIPPDPKP